MKFIFALPVLIFLTGCFPFPVNMQDEARALGAGTLRISAGAALNHLEMNAVLGVADYTDIYVKAGPESASLGVKQTVFDQPGRMSGALLAGGFLSGKYFDTESSGRDRGQFLGGIINWYDDSRIYSIQARYNWIDYHSQFNSSSGYDFLLSDRFQKITQLGASVRWRKPDSRYSLKLGVECYFGTDRLPEQPLFDERSSRDAGCVPVLGASFYTRSATAAASSP